VRAAERIRAAIDAADAGGYSTAALFYVSRADVEAVVAAVLDGREVVHVAGTREQAEAVYEGALRMLAGARIAPGVMR